MLAKVLRGGVENASGIEWPSADSAKPFFDNGGSKRSGATGAGGDGDFAALKAELENAKAEAAQRVQEAFAAGKREGDALARQAVDERLESELGKLRTVLQELNLAGPKLRRQTEEELVRLSIAIARRILHRELTVDPSALQGLVKAAFDRLDRREIKEIRTDADSIASVKKIVEGLGAPGSVKVIADATLRPGSLVIEVPRGQLDASIETQLIEIERGFVDIVRHS
jgi:flagellar assembly protein FliH